jgi:hypothetical protein
MIIDTPWNTKNELSQLAAAGVDTVVRYYNYSNSTTLPQKCLTAAEAKAIAAAGMKIAVTFQQKQNAVGDFSLAAGTAAGVQAFGYASATIGQPLSSTIYFSVDCDLYKSSEIAAVDAFFSGVRDAFTAASNGGPCYAVGVYGSGTVLDHLRGKGLATFFWLAQSHGWSGYTAFKNSGQWHLLQGAATKVAGLDVDTNDGNPANPDFGAFTLGAGTGADV